MHDARPSIKPDAPRKVHNVWDHDSGNLFTGEGRLDRPG